MPVIFIARWFPLPERREAFLTVISRLKDAFTPEILAGITMLQVCFNHEGHFVAVEMWDEEILNSLRASQVFHEAVRDLSACCSRPLEIEHLNPLGGDDGVFKRYPPGKADPRYYPDLGVMTPLYR